MLEQALSVNRTASRWALQSAIIRMLRPEEEGERGPAVCGCGAIGFNQERVNVHLRGRKASVSGVYRCDSAWLCPVCAPRRSKERQERVKEVVDAVLDHDGLFVMVTLTVRHRAGDRLEDLKRMVSEASRKARQGAPWLRIKAMAGIAGVLSAPEVTRGRRGWHYHVHLGIPCLSGDVEAAKAAAEKLVARYIAEIERLGGMALRKAQDVLIAESADDAADYIAKGASWELAGGIGTKDRAAGLTPWQIAELAAAGDRKAHGWWMEYAETMPGTRSCVVTKSMADALGIEAAEDDDCPGEQQLEEADGVVGTLDADVWAGIRRKALIGRLLGRLEIEGAAAWSVIEAWAKEVGRPDPIPKPRRREVIISAETLAREAIGWSAGRCSVKALEEVKARHRRDASRLGVNLLLPDDGEVLRLIAAA